MVPSDVGYWEQPMLEYQAYVIGEDGHIRQRLDLACADGGAAKGLLVDNRVIELWQSDHKIATFEPDPLKAEEAQGWLKGELRPPK
jgi:hypothetical protein